ncbi:MULTISPECIES: hypothetical protein [Brasilonema]|uniref:hypothetical protein n=1 Tax=Brasilonema TaxID=383614 RepID=UPI00351A34D5
MLQATLWLRWYDANNQWILTSTQQVEQERQRAEQERQRAERLAEYLRSQKIDPDNLPQM